MEHSFNPEDFIKDLASELVNRFNNASRATTPTLVGNARENEVRNKLERLLPYFAGVGTGCVIDSFGKTSKQTDIIIYEKEFCPVFSVNETGDCCYFPCEGVIAVGEIKSILDESSLKDSFAKIKSVKELKRFTENPRVWKSYGSKICAHGAEQEAFNQTNKYWDQIYGFILVGSFALKSNTLLEKYVECCKAEIESLTPNLLLSLNEGAFSFLKGGALWCEKKDSNAVVHGKNLGFEHLLSRIYEVIVSGRSVTVPIKKYLMKSKKSVDIGEIISF